MNIVEHYVTSSAYEKHFFTKIKFHYTNNYIYVMITVTKDRRMT